MSSAAQVWGLAKPAKASTSGSTYSASPRVQDPTTVSTTPKCPRCVTVGQNRANFTTLLDRLVAIPEHATDADANAAEVRDISSQLARMLTPCMIPPASISVAMIFPSSSSTSSGGSESAAAASSASSSSSGGLSESSASIGSSSPSLRTQSPSTSITSSSSDKPLKPDTIQSVPRHSPVTRGKKLREHATGVIRAFGRTFEKFVCAAHDAHELLPEGFAVLYDRSAEGGGTSDELRNDGNLRRKRATTASVAQVSGLSEEVAWILVLTAQCAPECLLEVWSCAPHTTLCAMRILLDSCVYSKAIRHVAVLSGRLLQHVSDNLRSLHMLAVSAHTPLACSAATRVNSPPTPTRATSPSSLSSSSTLSSPSGSSSGSDSGSSVSSFGSTSSLGMQKPTEPPPHPTSKPQPQLNVMPAQLVWRCCDVLASCVEILGGLPDSSKLYVDAIQSATATVLTSFSTSHSVLYNGSRLANHLFRTHGVTWAFSQQDGFKGLAYAAQINPRKCDVEYTDEKLCQHLITVLTSGLHQACSYKCTDMEGGTTWHHNDSLYNAHACLSPEVNLSGKISPQAFEMLLPCLFSFKSINLSHNGLDNLPEELGELQNLLNIDLSHNMLVNVPCSFYKLKQVELLNVEYNRIDRIYPFFGHHKMKLKFGHNPLKQIPFMAKTSCKQLKSYLRDLDVNSRVWDRVRLLVVGEEAAGKTSLIKRIQYNKFQRDSLATNGIEVSRKNFNIGDGLGSVKFDCWDFGGQICFYPTHQFFLSSKALYLVTFDLTLPTASTRVDYWLQQIEASAAKDHAPPPVLLVGTRAEEFETPEEAVRRINEIQYQFKRRFHNIKGAVPVSNSTGLGIPLLKTTLLKTAKDAKIVNMEIPESYHVLAKKIISFRKSNPEAHCITWTKFVELAGTSNIFCPISLSLVSEFLTNAGYMLHFENAALRDLVILDTQWLVNIMSTVISFTHGFGRKDGILKQDDLKQLFKGISSTTSSEFVDLMVKFDMAHYLGGREESIIVPCLLPAEVPTLPLFEGSFVFYRKYRFLFLPMGFIGRLMAQVLHTAGIELLCCWKYGLLIKDSSGAQQCLFIYDPSNITVNVEVRTLRQVSGERDSLLRLCVELIETLAEGCYPRLFFSMRREIPCNHCGKANSFYYEDIVSTFISGQSSIQCGSDSIPVRSLAPDITFSDIPVIDNINLFKKLGQGGFGAVYQGILPGSNIWVAVKELLVRPDDDNVEKFTQFQREAAVMNFFHHYNLVSLLGVSISPPRMILEYVAGGDLFQFIHPQEYASIKQDSFPWSYRVNIACDIARGMDYLQTIKPPVIHRDLRSANIFLTGTEAGPIFAKVADFGLSRRVSQMTDSLPNWEWLAPEVYSTSAARKNYDSSADVYSFALILWELATLALPLSEFYEHPEFSARTTNSAGKQVSVLRVIKIKKAIEEDGLRPTLCGLPTVPTGFNALITKCWSGVPTDRPTFAQALAILTQIKEELAASEAE
ncbi:leucine-rich repeat-containing protein [Pelomyxa schiedti]|nr:leucine-rich repeat-containing protein [Pelomyxa schiedti]